MKIFIPKNIRRLMKKQMSQAGKKEIGGILMAEQIDYQCFRIIEFSVDLQSGTTSRFYRDSNSHDKALQDFFQKTGGDYSRFNYIGEWHTHPSFDVWPSQQDIRAMQNLVDEPTEVSFAVLLIAKLNWIRQFKCCAFLFVREGSPIEAVVIYED